MGQNTPRVGVIGLGGIGRTHIASWKANGVTPVAFADAVTQAIEVAVAEHGGEGFSSGLDLIGSGSVDIVSICTPPASHRELAIAAAKAGIAVLCEKPLARSLEDAKAVAEAVETSGTLFSVGFCHRFEPAIERLKAMIDAGDLGEIMTFRNRFGGLMANAHETWFSDPEISGGGALADTSIHSIDLFRHLVGEPVQVQAMTSTRETEHGPALAVEDTGVITLRTNEGAIGVIESSWRTPPGEWTVTVYGTKGTAIVDYGDETFRVIRADGTVETVEVESGSRFDHEVAHFLACWQGEAELRVTVRDGLEANRVLDAAYKSAGMA
jgi:predicted dehydrogenase